MQNKPSSGTISIGVLSDTHGLLRPEIIEAFQGVERIFHTGDIGSQFILESLEKIAPVTAVRGNCDYKGWSHVLPVHQLIEVEGVYFYLLHDLDQLDVDPVAADISVVISGHTHQPKLDRVGGTLYLNPGSAGPRRFDYPISVARIEIRNRKVYPEIIQLLSV